MSPSTCRWGILGTASIVHKNWRAIKNAPNGSLVAVASRDKARSQQFIDECQAQVPFDPAPIACGSYEELIERDDVDAVYIPLPTGIRKEWVIRTAKAGKHVMCEKPCGLNNEEVAEIIETCDKAGVQFMDGVMFMHSRRLDRLREVLQDGTSVGDVRRITSQLTFCGDDDFLENNIRTNSDLEPHGVLGDLGWYTIRFSLWVMNYALPQKVSGRMLAEIAREGSPSPTPTEFAGELFFDGGVTASYFCSFAVGDSQWAHVSGTKGYVRIPDFVLPYFGSQATFDVTNAFYDVNGCDFHMEKRTREVAINEYSDSTPDAQETNLFRNFSELVLSGTPDPKWGDISARTQRVLEACLRSARTGGQLVEP